MKELKKFSKWLYKNKFLVAVLLLFAADIFLRIYQLDIKNPFGYDQVDNAWVAKNFIVNGRAPLVGMVAKTDSGIFIGPAYYYIVSFFYWIFNLNPISSQFIAILSGIFTFWIIYFVAKKLFSYEVAIIALILNTFNFNAILFDRVQWPVQLLPGISLIIFYLLYRVTLGEVKKIIPLAIAIGFAFSIHFTAIFFPIIVILSLPLFPRTKETIKYIFIALPFFIVWLIPNIIYSILNKSANSNATSYLSTYSHGFHLRRMTQLLGDAFIQFDPYLVLDKIKPFKAIALPLFFLIYLYKSFTSERKKFIYLVFLWFIVPWVIFTTYSGEISDYYFIINRFIVLLILSYFIYLAWGFKHKLVKISIVIFIIAYCAYGVGIFLPYQDVGLAERENKVKKIINEKGRVEFRVGVPESYLYYYFMRQKGEEVYVSKTK